MTMLTTQPANISVDPLEGLHAPRAAENTDPNALPFPEEAGPAAEVVDATGGGELATELAAVTAAPTAPSWDSDDNPFKAKVAELESTLNTFKPFIDKITEAEAAQKAAAVEAIAAKVEQASEESASPLSNEERVAVRTAITGYLAYKAQEPAINQERLVGTAINYAGRLLGDNATVGDLKKMASQLLSKYDNAQGMDAYVNARLEYSKDLAATQRTNVAADRVATGVDSVITAPAQSGSMSSLSDYEKAIYRGVDLTPKQWANYKALRVQRGLD